MTTTTTAAPVVSTAPLEEKIIVLEERARQSHGAQYGLKMIGAALSNMGASGLSNPLDVVKVRQQLRTSAVAAGASSSNAFWAVGADMLRTEGMQSFAQGLSASMLRELVYSSLRLGSYEWFKDTIYEKSSGALSKDGLPLKVAGASIAAALGSFLANPTDLVKVRMQRYYPSGSPYPNVFSAFGTVWREGAHGPAVTAGATSVAGGLNSLYRGAGATTIRGIILSTSQICAYDQVKQSLKRRGVMHEGIPLHLVASSFAGLFCSITSNPVDVIKVRIHTDKERRYKGTLDCVRVMLKTEGPLAFWKGFGMCWARLGTHTILSFLAFERIRVLFGISPL